MKNQYTKKEYGWAIEGEAGLYVGWHFTREEAKKAHCEDLGKSWEYCRKKGDKAVKIMIQF